MPQTPIIPQTITVHLGPPESDAENVTLPFLDYVANVASGEIYPTWPENAIRANMYAQISFALNRIYTEYYRTRGYDFDITSTTANDQFFVNGREVFDNIREIAGELFNDYIRREGSIEPLFAQYCNGTTVTCNGLSQWGTVTLAEQGYTPFEILRFYYGDDIELIKNAPIGNNQPSAPEVPLRLGSVNNDVRTLQIRLNRISNNFPSIPKILATDGSFGSDTEAAVKKFQEVFQLTPDGVVGSTTWYTIQNIYIGVKRLNDLTAEGVTLGEVTQQFPEVLTLGDSGNAVANVQYYITYLSQFYETIPPIAIDGVYGQSTADAVRSVQKTFGLPIDGVLGAQTWDAIYRAYRGIVDTIPPELAEGKAIPFGGIPLRIGSDSESVRLLQEYLNLIAESYPEIPPINPTGYFGPRTQESVIAFQRAFGLTPSGIVNAVTWSAIAALYNDLSIGSTLMDGQYPGFEIGST